MPSSKKDRKNGKEVGGVVAAVTRHGAKFSSGASGNGSPSPPAMQSPDMKPENPPATSPSPLLDAVSTTSFATATSNSPSTREWAKAAAVGVAGSPGNLISLVGESPPTAPSSYEDHRGGVASGWSSPRPVAGYHLPSVSPPTAPARRPLSFQMDTHYSPPDIHSQIASSSTRRSSMHSHYAQVRSPVNPPLPHQPQPHFYGAPDIDFELNPQSGIKAGEKGYYFGFDTFPGPSPDHLPGRDNVVVAGYEGGLEVHSVGKRSLEHRASLKGLRGGVHHAKILPWTAAQSDLFPLVAVVVHGPNLPLPTPGISVEGDYDAVSADRSEAMTNVNADAHTKDVLGTKATPGFIESYQTSVEVYSLRSGKSVCVLLEAPKIPLKTPITSPIFKAPPPSGAFQIKADAGSIVIASGITGECWVYRQAPVPLDHGIQFRCLGKLWTTLQQPLKGDPSQETERSRIPAPPPRIRPQTAIVTLNGRWIAYCPAAPSSQLALRATVPVPAQGRAPLLASVTPPQLPPVSAELDLPLAESVMNKIMRDATQELIQGAKWVGKQGWQAWNNYWNPPSTNPPPRSPPLPSQPWGGATAHPELAQFPPTHGSVTPPAPKEPGLVSILDIETMAASASLHPMTTFSIPHGCSFLSFSPTGLSLFTASSKGDVQSVWDLMRIQYTRSSPLQSSGLPASGGPRVRQVAQFSRMTVARIVDVAWTRPNGERAAMVTERGTVHLLDLPSSAFTWPPPRRRVRPQDGKGAGAEGAASAVTMASNALNSVRDAARPLITRPRRSSSNAQQSGFGDYATHGGKVIAAGISHSLGKTSNAINQLRHTGENRVSLPSTTTVPGPSCVAWIGGKKDHVLFVLGDGLVRAFSTKSRKPSSGGERQRAPRLSRYKDFKVPGLPDDALAPFVKRYLDPDEYLDLSEKDLDAGNNTLVLNHRVQVLPHAPSSEAPITQAEIESSAPYQPFHTDRRVVLFEYDEVPPQNETSASPMPTMSTLLAATSLDDEPAPSPGPRKKSKASKASKVPSTAHSTPDAAPDAVSSSLMPQGAWAFGGPIAATQLDVGRRRVSEDEGPQEGGAAALYESRALPASAMERFLQRSSGGPDGDADQIVVTTRRRRGVAAAAAAGLAELGDDDDGFFEDDCEVLDFADQRV